MQTAGTSSEGLIRQSLFSHLLFRWVLRACPNYVLLIFLCLCFFWILFLRDDIYSCERRLVRFFCILIYFHFSIFCHHSLLTPWPLSNTCEIHPSRYLYSLRLRPILLPPIFRHQPPSPIQAPCSPTTTLEFISSYFTMKSRLIHTTTPPLSLSFTTLPTLLFSLTSYVRFPGVIQSLLFVLLDPLFI